jgi:hypothetical protein
MSADVDLKPMLMLRLRGPNLEFKPQPEDRRQAKPVYSFTGRYEGSTESRWRQVVPVGTIAEEFQIPILVGSAVK